MAKCDCYFQHGTKFLCYGTKEREECSCGGDESKCNFYPEKRKQKMANEKRLIALDEAIAKVKDDGILGEGYSEDERIDDVCDILESCEIVDAVEVKHGRWLDVKETEFYSPDHRCTFTHTAETCSNCKVRIGFIGSKQYLYDNQCPNCGAKTDGDGNG